MSFTLMPTSSTLEPVTISKAGPLRVAHVDLDRAVIEPALAQLLAQPLARGLGRIGQARDGADRPRARGVGGSSRSSSRSSAAWRACGRSSSKRSSRTIAIASSTRSRTIDSTSRPT